MLIIILSSLYMFISIAQGACITKAEAITIAWNALNTSLCHTDNIDNEYDYEQCETAQYQVKNQMSFKSPAVGWSVLIREFECAAGASCWEWYTISCRGKLTLHRNGEN